MPSLQESNLPNVTAGKLTKSRPQYLQLSHTVNCDTFSFLMVLLFSLEWVIVFPRLLFCSPVLKRSHPGLPHTIPSVPPLSGRYPQPLSGILSNSHYSSFYCCGKCPNRYWHKRGKSFLGLQSRSSSQSQHIHSEEQRDRDGALLIWPTLLAFSWVRQCRTLARKWCPHSGSSYVN